MDSRWGAGQKGHGYQALLRNGSSLPVLTWLLLLQPAQHLLALDGLLPLLLAGRVPLCRWVGRPTRKPAALVRKWMSMIDHSQ